MVGDIVYSALVGLKFDQGLGGISWSIRLMVLGRLIPRSGKDSIVRSLGVLFLDDSLLIAFFVYSGFVVSRLTRQFTSSPLICEFFGDSHHQIPLM